MPEWRRERARLMVQIDQVALGKLIAMYMEIRPDAHGVDVEVLDKDQSPMGIRDYCGTERVGDEPADVFKDRLTRCNELTNYALLWGDAPEATRLVHGSIHGPYEGTERIQHSWLVTKTSRGELVWEPITHLWYDKEAWYAYARAWDEREYTRRQTWELTMSSGHYGPWHESRYP